MEEKPGILNVPSNDPRFINPGLPSLTKLYANNFATGYSAADIYIIGQVNGAPTFVLNLSFTSAKSLSKMLADTVENFEKTAEFEIHPVEEIAEKFKEKGKI